MKLLRAQWLTTGYLLTLAILVPISALLMKWFSTRKLVAFGLVVSMLGAVFAAFGPIFGILMTGRVVQAIGTGVIMPVMTSVLLVIFPIHKRGVVMGIMGLVITLGPALGPTLSGVIISTLGWNYIFWISAAFYVILTFAAFVKIENVGEITKPKIDVIINCTINSRIWRINLWIGFYGWCTFYSSCCMGTFISRYYRPSIIWTTQNSMEKPMIN